MLILIRDRIHHSNLCILLLFEPLHVIDPSYVHAEALRGRDEALDQGIIISVIHPQVILHFFQCYDHLCLP